MEEFCREMPKIELHAHLNGSTSERTIEKLLKRRSDSSKGDDAEGMNYKMKDGEESSLDICFKKFNLLHELCSDDEAIFIITKDVISEFASDNVKYLELRTGPKANPASNMTKTSYLLSVLRAIKKVNHQENNEIIVKLIISINREKSLEEAWENLELAKKFRNYDMGTEDLGDVIVGIDLSGSPFTTDVDKFIPVLRAAKDSGFKLTLHISEIADRDDESRLLMSLNPNRLGHATNLSTDPNQSMDIIQDILTNDIPLELCLTSNMMTSTVADITSHHLEYWLDKNHPCLICTDDKGVFSTCLTKEFVLASSAFNLSKEVIWKMNSNAIKYIFASDEVKERLKIMFSSFKM